MKLEPQVFFLRQMSATKQKYGYLQIVIIESIDILISKVSPQITPLEVGRAGLGRFLSPPPICKLLISNNMVSREIWINMHE